MREIDNRIERDLHRFVDGAVKSQIERTKRDLLLWMLTYEIVQRGTFSKRAQAEMSRIFDDDTTVRLRTFLAEFNRAEAEKIVYQKLTDARQTLEVMIPATFSSEIKVLESIVQERADLIFSNRLGTATSGG